MKALAYKTKSRIRESSSFFNSKNSSGFFGVQPKLKVGQSDDKYEEEADRVADKVVSGLNSGSNAKFLQAWHNSSGTIQEKPFAETITPIVQKQEEEEEEEMQAKVEGTTVQMQVQDEEEEEPEVQMQPEEEEEDVQMQQEEEKDKLLQSKPEGQLVSTSSVETALKTNAGGGHKMDTSTQTEMERGFGTDFSDVKIHTDTRAVQMSKLLGAQAFTHGKDIYFNKGKYSPQTNDGKHLLAHELTHTIQQTGNVSLNLQFTIGDNHDLQSARFIGNNILQACNDGEQTLHIGSRGAAVTLIQQALVDAGYPLPAYGVDGIFGNETRSALQNFQRASSLPATGVINSATISALDALFSGGAPAFAAHVPHLPAAPVITSTETIKAAPDGTSNTRRTIGVGERVRFTANTAGTWSASAGHIIGMNNGINMVWEAPPIASAPIITLTTPAGSTIVTMTVIAPNGISMTVARHHAIPAGTAGACMINNVKITPLNVNFGRTQWLEVPGPATNVTGYFNRFTAADIFHHPNPNYLPLNDHNSGLNDHAAWHGVPGPFSFGTFEWVIPNRYKIDGESDAQGRIFTNTVQAFYMFNDGTMFITKAGASVMRFINNTVL